MLEDERETLELLKSPSKAIIAIIWFNGRGQANCYRAYK